jgi:ADP-heptose:LPS heptosyltransferase
VRHVLVCRLDSDGDVLLTGPAIRAVAAAAARFTLLCGPRGRAAAELLPGVDEVIAYRAPWIDPEPGPVRREEVLSLANRLAELRADEGIVFTSSHQSALPTALVLRLAGVGRVAAISEDYPGSLLDVRRRDPGDVHEVERALCLAAAAGYVPPEGDDVLLRVRRPRRAGANAAGEGPYVVLHPGASVPARAPSPAWSRTVVAALGARGRRVVVTGGPDERELTARVAGAHALDLGGATDLAGLAEVLAGADAVVVGNTGPAHLAAAVGTPVVSLFAPVVPALRWRPWGVEHVLLGDQEGPCRGTRARACPVAGHPCLDGIRVDDVVAAVDRLAPLREAVAA